MFAVVKGDRITDEILDKKEVTGTLGELIEKTQALIRLYLPEPVVLDGMRRAETATIPAGGASRSLGQRRFPSRLLPLESENPGRCLLR